MEIRELRIGNYLQNNEGKKEEVFYINASNIGVLFGEYPVDFLFPIPLTEEWLIKFGFEKCGNCYINEIALYKTNETFSYNASFFEHDNLIEIESVHKLQNLWYILIGKQLQTINF